MPNDNSPRPSGASTPVNTGSNAPVPAIPETQRVNRGYRGPGLARADINAVLNKPSKLRRPDAVAHMSGALPTQEDSPSEDGREEKEESASTTDEKEDDDEKGSKKDQQKKGEQKGEEWAIEKRDDDARSE